MSQPDQPLPPWPPDPPTGPWGPRAAAMSDDGSHERLYNPDGFGCGAPTAICLALAGLALLALPVLALAAIGGQ